ncbi:MAG: hypothetical protein JWO89_1295 [Verrucomicrobiaceae bacterium]|nr:hypothetical protein [Verrucomicrobiaceae bacterium]MDB6119316.1 hypothetical protein [Verrucomicrobiaceae bacterium]
MLQQWNIRSRAHQCAVSGRQFEDGEKHYTAIYFDPETGGYSRRDVGFDSWQQELAERQPFSFWKSIYTPNATEERPELATKESGMMLLQHMIEEDDPYTENARYILALMLERKRILTPTAAKETEKGRMLFYENRKTGDAFIIRDPELRLDEVAGVQEEVATLLGFGPDRAPLRSSKSKTKSKAETAPEASAPVVEEPAKTTDESPAETESEATTECAENAEDVPVERTGKPEAESEPESAQEVDEESGARL